MTVFAPLVRDFERTLAASGAKTSVVLLDARQGERFESNAQAVVKAASLIKLPLLWELYARADEGHIDLNETLTLDDSHRVDGGLLHRFSRDAQLRLDDLALLAGAVSDNSATNLLIDRLGMEAVNSRAADLGLPSTRLERRMLDGVARAAGRENWTSAADLATLLAALTAPGTTAGLTPAGKTRLLEILASQKLQNKLAAQLPCDDVDDLEQILAHKTGELPGCEHDVGILFPFGERPLVLAVMTFALSNRLDGVSLCARLGRIAYDHWTEHRPIH